MAQALVSRKVVEEDYPLYLGVALKASGIAFARQAHVRDDSLTFVVIDLS